MGKQLYQLELTVDFNLSMQNNRSAVNTDTSARLTNQSRETFKRYKEKGNEYKIV